MMLRRYHKKEKAEATERKPKAEPKKRNAPKKKEGETDATES